MRDVWGPQWANKIINEGMKKLVRGLYLDRNFINWNKISDCYREVKVNNSNSVKRKNGKGIQSIILEEAIDENFSLAHC